MGSRGTPEQNGSRSVHTMPFGTRLLADGSACFRILAPAAEQMQIALDGQAGPLQMQRLEDGWHELAIAAAHAGSRYRYILPDGTQVPDPASRYQPEDVSGPSEVIDPLGYSWQDATWRGLPWHATVLYELHVGTFTPEGTFRAAISRLDYFSKLGINAIELMCVADFRGRWSWGYDPVLLFAPDSAYGTPDDLKALIDAAHGRGLQVILDVVYNHFGPQGNFLSQYFPEICSSRHETPWGKGLNFDGEGSHWTRELIIHNALYWIEEFHADGLRLDATHTLLDTSRVHLLDELAARVADVAGDRVVHLIVEHEENIPRKVGRGAQGEVLAYVAQWNYDIPRLLTAVFSDFCQPGLEHNTEQVAWAVAQGFSVLRHEGKDVVPDEYFAPPPSFVAFLQTHDLVGNRIFGDRMSVNAPPDILRALTAIVLLMPQVPMLLMGQEWGSKTPFPFFSDYAGEVGLHQAEGRKKQFHELIPEPSEEEMNKAPDPQAESTFRSAHLDWGDLDRPECIEWLELHRRLLDVRRTRIVPHLAGLSHDTSSLRLIAPGAFVIRWQLDGGVGLQLAVNLCRRRQEGFPPARGERLWQEGEVGDGTALEAFSVLWTLEKPDVASVAAST